VSSVFNQLTNKHVMTGMFCRDRLSSGLSLGITLRNSALLLYKPVPLTKDSSINNIADSRGLRDSNILWKKPPGVSNVLVVPSRYAVFADFMHTLYNTVWKEHENTMFWSDVSVQDFRRPQVLP
jgi:hypothetical protein